MMARTIISFLEKETTGLPETFMRENEEKVYPNSYE